MAIDASRLTPSSASTTPRRETAVRRNFLARIALAVVLCAGVCASAEAQQGTPQLGNPFSVYPLEMYDRPRLELDGWHLVHQAGLVELWMRALQRPDAELQRMVVDTLAIAHDRGVPGLEVTVDRMAELLQQPETRLDVRRAIAQTLVTMDAEQHAEPLAELSRQYTSTVAAIVEPALGRWKSNAMRDAWLQRVRENSAGPALISLAIEGLSALEDAEAADPLAAIANNPSQPTDLRLLAARHLGHVRKEGMPELARQMLDRPARHPELSALIAIELLTHDASPAARELLAELVEYDRTAVQSRALGRLYEIDYRLVDQYAEKLIGSPDANVRKWIARSMLDTNDPGRTAALANLLDDVNPTLRQDVAAGLIRWGYQEALVQDVLAETMRVLNQDSWRGCEQACVVLTRLDHKPSGSRMVELLKHPRGEVKVASAWGLSQLRLSEHLPAMLDHANEVYADFQSRKISLANPGYNEQMAHLFIAFGDQMHRPAETLMRAYIPKNFDLGVESRSAAVWAIGLLYEDQPNPELAKQLAGRLSDLGLISEMEDIRQMSALSIGRMKSETELPALRQFREGNSYVARACQWAVEKLTGEPMDPLMDNPVMADTYFLAPVDKQATVP